MTKNKLTIAYDGTNYFGWQIQPDKLSVQQALQDAYKHIFGESITMLGASRTDAGVHALGHVATFNSSFDIPLNKMLFALNNALPKDIVIRSIEKVPDKFHPQYNVLQKTYWYHFFTERPLPFVNRYGWYVHTKPDLSKLQECLSVFVGTHDFRSFCTGDEQENTVRTIDSITFEYIKRFNAYRIAVKGPGFLRYMIRRIVGASMVVASRSELSVQSLYTVLEQKDPRQTLLNAPAHGLTLRKIQYKSD